MSIPAELKSVTRNFLEQLLVCRPTDTISFAVQYYSDERAATPLVSHAVHSLMFLIRRPVEFRSAVGTIFCAEFLSSGAKSPKSPSTSAAGAALSAPPSGVDNSADGAPPAAASSATAGEAAMPTDEDDTASEGQNAAASTKVATTGDSNETAADALAPVANESSAKLQTLYKVARAAIRNAYSSSASSAGAAAPSQEGEMKDWLCALIEAALGGEAIAKSAVQDFETCVAFLRSYLSLRIIAGCVFESVTQRAQVSTYLQKETDATPGKAKPASLGLEITTTIFVQPEDVELIEQIINATLANQPGSEKFPDVQKTVSVVVNQYMSLLRGKGKK